MRRHLQPLHDICRPLLCVGLVVLLGHGCVDGAPEPPRPALRSAALEAAPEPARVQLDRVPVLGLHLGREVVRGGWGDAPGQFGKRDEASRPGPMSLAIGPDGAIHVLDQVNRRVQRFDRAGRLAGTLAMAAETTEDIALARDGALWALVYEPGDSPGYRVERYAGGARTASLRLDRAIQLATGLFVTGTADVWVEEAHERQIQVARGGQPLQGDAQQHVLGRPHRGQPGARLSATLLGSRAAAVIHVRPGQGTHKLLEVGAATPLVGIHALASDADGSIYLGLLLGREPAPGAPLVDARRLLLVHHPDGGGDVAVELARGRATDAFRPLAVGGDGSVHQLHSDADGVTVRRWTVARTARAGGAR